MSLSCKRSVLEDTKGFALATVVTSSLCDGTTAEVMQVFDIASTWQICNITIDVSSKSASRRSPRYGKQAILGFFCLTAQGFATLVQRGLDAYIYTGRVK